MGSDTGGSIRGPAAYSGVVGFKPTFGLVSRFGTIPVSEILDHVGPLTRRVEDAAAVLHAVSGYDERDSATRQSPVPNYLDNLDPHIRGTVIGIPDRMFAEGVDCEVMSAVTEAIDTLKKLGCRVRDIPSHPFETAFQIGPVISKAEAVHYHRQWIRDRFDDYGPWCKEFLVQAREITAADYLNAIETRRTVVQALHELMQDVDVIVGPTCPVVAPRIDQETATIDGNRLRLQKIVGMFTQPFNVTGQPAVSVPCGFSRSGLPIGLQIAGRLWEDQVVLNVAYAFQMETDWHRRRPGLPG